MICGEILKSRKNNPHFTEFYFECFGIQRIIYIFDSLPGADFNLKAIDANYLRALLLLCKS